MATKIAERCVLLLGANGQVGHELQRTLAALGPVVALDVPQVDFSQPNTLRNLVRQHRPSIIINAAAYTAVDKAESEAELAISINAVAPGVLAEEAQSLGACLVHYSTDYVFDGRKLSPYVETDEPNPLSVYGRSKLDSERAVQSACERHLVFRTSWVISAHGHNFVKTILRLAAERECLRIVADQIGAPTSATLLADRTTRVLSLMQRQSAGDERWGLYHLVAGGETSWHGLACHSVAYARAAGLALKSTPETVVPIRTAEYPTPAHRPANSRLDTSKLRSYFTDTLPDWTDGVNNILDQLISEIRS